MEKLLIYDFQTTHGYCVIEAYPSLHIIDVYGHGELTIAEMNEIDGALNSEAIAVDKLDRFIFQFPNQQTDVAFRLAAFLQHRIYKCAFIVPDEQHNHFKPRLFWQVCSSAFAGMAHVEALRLIGRYEVKEERRTDAVVDYRSIHIDRSLLNAPFDEGF